MTYTAANHQVAINTRTQYYLGEKKAKKEVNASDTSWSSFL